MKEKIYKSLENVYATKVCVYCDKKKCSFEVERNFISNKVSGDIHIVKCKNYKLKS